jgi:hypothetical protein
MTKRFLTFMAAVLTVGIAVAAQPLRRVQGIPLHTTRKFRHFSRV